MSGLPSLDDLSRITALLAGAHATEDVEVKALHVAVARATLSALQEKVRQTVLMVIAAENELLRVSKGRSLPAGRTSA